MSAAFLLGLLGSWHCAAMCGGFVIAFSRGQRTWPYQMGRFLGYAGLGALLGWGGQKLTVYLGSQLLFALGGTLLMGMGLAALRPPKVLAAHNGFSLKAFLWMALAPWLRQPGPRSQALMGLLTAGFPCGLLYAACVQAASTSSPWNGLLSMSAFWLGTLPGLVLPAWFGRHLPQRWVTRVQAAAMLTTGAIMLAFGLWPTTPGEAPCCHACH